MLKRIRLYAAVSLLIQSVSFMVLVILFLYKNKRNTAGAFCAMGLAGGVVGTFLMVKQLKEQFRDRDILAAIDELCETGKISTPAVPVDDTADETEFNA